MKTAADLKRDVEDDDALLPLVVGVMRRSVARRRYEWRVADALNDRIAQR